jgi:hypothetical protein
VFLFISEFDDNQGRNSDDSMPSRGLPAAAISDHYPGTGTPSKKLAKR